MPFLVWFFSLYAFGKWVAKEQTAPLIAKCDHCLRSPHKLKFAGTPSTASLRTSPLL